MTDPKGVHGNGTSYYPIVGRKDTGGAFERIPIEDMQKNHPRQFTLFVLSYAAVQGVRNLPVSTAFPGIELPAATYMEIAGLHGKPYKEYAGDRKTPKERAADYSETDPKDTLPTPSRFGGMHLNFRYFLFTEIWMMAFRLLQVCYLPLAIRRLLIVAFPVSHASVSFTTWHRPYMLLIEVCDSTISVVYSIQRSSCSKLLETLQTASQPISKGPTRARLVSGSQRLRNSAFRMSYHRSLFHR